MVTDSLILFEGEVHYIVGEAIVETPINGEESLFTVVYALNRIETANTRGVSRAIWVRRADCQILVSGMNYNFSEFYLGVVGGKSR